jgi:hypothetical protein
MDRQFHSRREYIFKALGIVFILVIIWYFFFQLSTYITNRKIENNQNILNKQNLDLAKYKQSTWYNKIYLIRELEKSSQTMPRSEHIPKIISILEDLKSVDSSLTWENDSIILSDFKVNLNEISLKWRVSNLKLLYFNSPSWKFKALIDRFQDLDFIEDMKIKTYDKIWEKYFEFVLNAKIKNNGK